MMLLWRQNYYKLFMDLARTSCETLRSPLIGDLSGSAFLDGETYDGRGYRMTFETELKDETKQVAEAIREVAYKLEHKDDMPDWVKEKFQSSTQPVDEEVN